VRNEERHIEACLASVQAQEAPEAILEILVADGRSTDRTREIVMRMAAEDPRIRLVDNPGKIVPTAMNAAIREARGEFVVRVDGHATIPSDYVRRVLACFDRTSAACVGGRMDARGEGYWGRVISRVTSHPFGVGNARFHYSDVEGESDTVYLGAYRRSTLLEIGLYDERFVRNQDDELNYRLRGRGGRVWFDPAIRADYVNRSTPGKLFRQYRQYGFWKVRLYRKHPRMFHPRHAAPAAFVGACALGLLLAPVAPVAGPGLAIGLMALHLATGLTASLVAGWSLRVCLGAPPAFLVLHGAYGIGTWQGLLDAVLRRGAFRP
jgi:glycosyltransferase involved in cell wall biosynthesis